MKKVFCFDIDKTLCQEVTQVEDYLQVDPISEMIEFVKILNNTM